ncbi:hypothetical protein FBR01_05220 [Anaerolineae bacterium CFX8]|nr:hypothetical protein [Anaerolineae bacterium CFX8]
MHKGWRHYGHHWGHHRGHHWGKPWMRRRGGFFFFWPGMLLVLFLAFGVFKFLWPLLLIGLGIMLVKSARHWNGGSWDEAEKPKNDGEKPKRDDRRYIQTEDGDWLEII